MDDPIAHRLQQVAGSHVNGSFRIQESTVNELLRRGPAPLSACDVAIAAGNRIVVRYGMLHATATIDGYDAGPSPRLRLTLASLVVALALRAWLRQPYVQASGRQVEVAIAAVPALAPYAAIWPHVRRVHIETAPARARVDVEVFVGE
jgi:hypothetical protein